MQTFSLSAFAEKLPRKPPLKLQSSYYGAFFEEMSTNREIFLCPVDMMTLLEIPWGNKEKKNPTTSNWLSISQLEVTASIFKVEAKQASKCTSTALMEWIWMIL